MKTIKKIIEILKSVGLCFAFGVWCYSYTGVMSEIFGLIACVMAFDVILKLEEICN